MTLTHYELLADTRALIRKGWTQNAYARDKDDNITYIADQHACSWCLTGALHRASLDSSTLGKNFMLVHQRLEVRQLLEAHANGSLSSFNDSPKRTKEDVLALIDKVMDELRCPSC